MTFLYTGGEEGTIDNPYTPPAAALEGGGGDAEADRREHLKHEASLKAIGSLMLFGGVLTVPVGFLNLAQGFGAYEQDPSGAVELAGIGLFSLVLGVGNLFAGRGLRRLEPSVKRIATLLSGISLISVPVGTLIGGYSLWLIHSAKGKRIFASDYAAVVAATPQVVYRTSLLVWGGVILLIGLAIASLIGLAAMG